MTGDSENSLFSVCFKPVHLLPVVALLLFFSLCVLAFLPLVLSFFSSHLYVSIFSSFFLCLLSIFSFSFWASSCITLSYSSCFLFSSRSHFLSYFSVLPFCHCCCLSFLSLYLALSRHISLSCTRLCALSLSSLSF